jgi:8-oxo-dGTP pyrophosphatase MutT (NUDIX family)
VPHIYMGRRHASLKFMPGFLVFPGGRVEARDRLDHTQDRLTAACARVLDAELAGMAGSSFARAALRECLEETGLALACHLDGDLTYIARAVTPPHLPIRYDTRFFLARVKGSAAPPKPAHSGDGELLQPGWFAAPSLVAEPLHHVTRAVLNHGLLEDVTEQSRLLIADRLPKRWEGAPPLRSRDLKAAQAKSSAAAGS